MGLPRKVDGQKQENGDQAKRELCAATTRVTLKKTWALETRFLIGMRKRNREKICIRDGSSQPAARPRRGGSKGKKGSRGGVREEDKRAATEGLTAKEKKNRPPKQPKR